MNTANDYNDAVEANTTWAGDVSPFDTCGGLLKGTTNDDGSLGTELVDTKWSVILAFNSYFYLIHCILTFLILLGATGILWPCCILGGCGHCCGFSAHLAAVVVTGVYRLRDEGDLCANRVLAVDTDGTTF